MRSAQAVAIAAVLIIGVLLFIAPRLPSVNAVDSETKVSMKDLWKEKLASLAEKDRERIGNFAEQGEADSLRSYFLGIHDALGFGIARSFIAERSGKTEDWMAAGQDLYRAAMMQAPEHRGEILTLAITAFDKVLEKSPKDKEARLKKGVCLVEQRQDPMKGVGLLKALTEEDSTFIDAHLQLGFFSLQSSQWDKAEERFRKVLGIDSTYIDAWLYLAQTHELKGDKTEAIKEYEKYHDLQTDTLVRAEVRKYINKIKN